MPAFSDPTKRFTDRVVAYDRGRPGYPAALFDAIVELGHLGRVSAKRVLDAR